MARKRARSQDAGDAADADQVGQADAAQQQASRRQDMKDIARRRAAHFANFNDEAVDDGNVHVGSNEARNLGPWSSAVELVNARQAAAEQRKQQLAEATQQQAPEVQWSPSRDPALGPRPCCPVQPLFNLALQLLVGHIDAVTSLWGVPDSIRSRLAAAVCAQRQLSPDAAQLFAADTPSELVLPDCWQLDGAAMLQLLGLLVKGASPEQQEGLVVATDNADRAAAAAGDDGDAQESSRLERLELGSCGRGFGDDAAAALAAAGPLQQLRVLRLGGAYRLGDGGLLALLEAAPVLKELAVPSASRLTGSFLSRLPAAAPQLACLDLSDCRGLPGSAIAGLLGQLVGLARLTLDGIPEVDAAVLTAAGRCPSLRALSVAMCTGVTDDALTAFAAASRPGGSKAPGSGYAGSSGQACQAFSGLEELVLDECTAITDTGLLAIAGACRSLRLLSVRRCCRLSDASLVAVAERGTLEVLNVDGVHLCGSATLQALGKSCKDTLRELDISFCRSVQEGAVGQLVDRCEKLSRLKVYGCSQLTSRLLHGHSNEGLVEVLGVSTSATT